MTLRIENDMATPRNPSERKQFVLDVNPGQIKKFEGFWWRVDSLENNQVTMTAVAPSAQLQLLNPTKNKKKRKKKKR